MSDKIVQLNEEVIKGQLKELVRGSVEETLNELMEQEASNLTQATRYERNKARQGYRSGHYDRTYHHLRRRHAPCTSPQGSLFRDRYHRAVSPTGKQRGGGAH